MEALAFFREKILLLSVVGFAFLVPDTGWNECYLSYCLTHPDWQAAGIGITINTESIIYLSRVLCLSFVLSYSFLSSCHPVILSSCHICGNAELFFMFKNSN